MRPAQRTAALLAGVAVAWLWGSPSAQGQGAAAPPRVFLPAGPPQSPAPIAYRQPRDSRGVLSSFSSRGGIGTTPFLGNTRGLGVNSVNYDRRPRSAAGQGGWRPWFRRTR